MGRPRRPSGLNRRRLAATALAGMALLAGLSPAFAQDSRKGSWEIGMYLGLQQFGINPTVIGIPPIPTDTLEIETDFLLGTRAGYNITNHIEIEFVWDYITTRFKDPFNLFALDSTSWQLNAIYNIRSSIVDGIDPYILVGFGIINQEVEIPRIPGFLDPGISIDNSDNLVTAGLGLRIWGTEGFGFRFELKREQYTMVVPTLGGILNEDVNDYEFTFGVMWSVGRGAGLADEEEIPLDFGD